VSDNRNFLIAIVLSALVLLGWSVLSDRYIAKPLPPKPVIAAQPANPVAVATDGTVVPAVGGAGQLRDRGHDRGAVLRETPRVAIDTPRLSGSINLKGARIDDLVLKGYTETIAKTSPDVRLFAPSGAPNAYFSQFGWSGTDAPPADALWTASAGRLTPATPVTLSYTAPGGTAYEIVLAVDSDYLFTATQRVRNPGATPVTVRPWGLVSHAGEGLEKDAGNLHVGPLGVVGDRLKDSEVAYKKLTDDGPQSFPTTGGWLGITDKYWAAALIPDQKTPVVARFAKAQDDRFQTDYLSPAVVVAPGATVATTAHLFAGAKEVGVIDRYKTALGIPLFDRIVSWGWFWFIAQPIFQLLDFLFKLFGNFGVAIIGLTCIIRLIMFPIAAKQFSSMARMRVVQPKLKELQDRHKDDKPKLQTEMMALYKKEKVNPVAGCLPVVLQIPIFYALYKTLLVSTEMRHQPFVLWIKDLSVADPLTPVNLFGLLPFTPPAMIGIGLLPIILGVTMYFQQKLNPAPVDPAQKQIFALMPWVFMFIMAPYAAGLVVYWVTNNCLTMLQQWFMMRKFPVPATPVVSK
jgi:YidC/Oxa1 family membrane protein insertase